MVAVKMVIVVSTDLSGLFGITVMGTQMHHWVSRMSRLRLGNLYRIKLIEGAVSGGPLRHRSTMFEINVFLSEISGVRSLAHDVCSISVGTGVEKAMECLLSSSRVR